MDAAERRAVVTAVCAWFDQQARDLPWRRPETTPWGVLVSEFMLQQTPVSRVLAPWQEFMARWPEPRSMASVESGEVVAAWGRLGYPRRALRLHAASRAIAERHSGHVPDDLAELRALPGVGEYTAAAVHSFGFGGRAAVLDTNVRRVLTRLELGRAYPAPTATAAEWRLAQEWVPEDAPTASGWAAASMELGAVICRARTPRCDECPVADHCRWLAAGRPAHDGPPRKGQPWQGTDRQCRGALLSVVRSAGAPVEAESVLKAWPDADQASRALAGLMADGLVHRNGTSVQL